MLQSNRRNWVIAIVGGLTVFAIALFLKANKINIVNFFDLGIVTIASSFLLTVVNDQYQSNQELLNKNQDRLRVIESILSYFKEIESTYKYQACKLNDAVENAEEKILEVQILLEQHCKNSEKTAQELEETKKSLVELRIFVEAWRYNK